MQEYEQKYGSHENLAKNVRDLEKSYDLLNTTNIGLTARLDAFMGGVTPRRGPPAALRMPPTHGTPSQSGSSRGSRSPRSASGGGDGGGMGAAMGGIRRGLGGIFGAAQP